jgi:hypothetical protein
MIDLQVNVAVVDGTKPRDWLLFGQLPLGDLVDRVGTISALSESFDQNKRINVDVMLDDVSKLANGQCRSVSGIVVDGELLLRYSLDVKNPCLGRLQRVLQLMNADKLAVYRQFGLRVWIVGTDTHTYRYRYKSIVEKVVGILKVKPSEIKVTFVKSVEVMRAELADLAEELALIEDFVSLEGS